MSIIGPYLTGYGYDVQNYDAKMLSAVPNAEHWFGTDNLGRDLFSRVWIGGRVSLIIGFVGTIIELIVGTIYGGVSGYFGGAIDTIMMRIVEIINSIPYLLVVILLLIVMPKGILTLIVALCITGWAPIARLIRGQVLQLKESEYVLAAKALGASPTRIISRHLIPNTIGVIIVYMTMDVPSFIFAEAFLSFLGLGVQAPNTSWGALIQEGQGVMTLHPHILLFPAIALCLTVIAFNLLGDGLRDAFDPRLRQ
jgi:oligopeptide transport system permease protein